MPSLSLFKTYFSRCKSILQNEGLASLINRGKIFIARNLGIDAFANFDNGYRSFIAKQHPPLSTAQVKAWLDQLKHQPQISILVPIYNVEAKWLNEMILSVRNQSYPNWQLCLVDDCSSEKHIMPLLKQAADNDSRICIAQNAQNSGIANTSNHAAQLASGEYFALLDHDDYLHVDALMHNIIAINTKPTCELLYSDEDKITLNNKRHTPFFKPDFNLDLLRSQNYLGHFIVIKRSLFEKIGGFFQGFDGAQDYDLLLRASEQCKGIYHITKPLYHWRQIPGSTAQSFSAKNYAWEAGARALQQHCQRQQVNAKVKLGQFPGTYDIDYALPDSDTIVSIIIPFKDKPELLDTCLKSIIKHNHWHNIEIIAIDNQSEQPQTHQMIKKWQSKLPTFRYLQYAKPFNFSAICNFGAKHASGSYLLFMNNDIEITSDNFVEALLRQASRPDIGAVGAKLYYPNKRIQHAGIVIGINACAGHVFKHFPATHPGYFLRCAIAHNVSAVTAAVMMVEKTKFLQINGFNETEFAIAFNDVDLCLKLIAQGYRNLYTPHCQAIHHESISRGKDTDGSREQRFNQEKQNLQNKWPQYFQQGDPLYNPNLTLIREDYSLNREAITHDED